MFKVSGYVNKKALGLALLVVFVCSTSVYAADAGHHVDKAAQIKDFGWRVLNFVALALIIWWALKKANVKSSMADRSLQIEKSLKDAQEAKAAAEAKLIEYTGKLETAAREIDEIHAAIVREGEQEKQRIINEAKLAAEKIMAQAAQSAEQETLKAREELRAEAARLAVEIARGRLAGAIGKSDHDRFVGEYLDKVEQLQ